VVRSRDPVVPLDLVAAARSQDRLYQPVSALLGAPWCTRTAWLARPWLGVVVTGPAQFLTSDTLSRAAPQSMPGIEVPLIWGLPIGSDGAATDAEAVTASHDPAAARRLDGPFALVAVSPTGGRLTTSAYLVHAMQTACGPHTEAWSTRGLAAVVAAGLEARINPDALAEYVTMDYVLGDEELLADVRSLPEAVVVDIRADGSRESCYWPLPERFAISSPTGAAELRAVLGATMGRAGALPGAHLALTAGRDSVLLASCAAEHGAMPATFTIGTPETPDVVGARAVAGELGWSHRILSAEQAVGGGVGGSVYSRVIASSYWTEGLDTAWNLAAPPLDWTGSSDVSWLSGSGGEIGRAFYWSWAAPEADDVDVLVGGVCRHMNASAQSRLRERATAALHEAGNLTDRRGRDRLDVIYARGRMRKWLERSLPRPECRGTFAGYLAPSVVSTLMNIPAEAKRSGAVFDEALRAAPDLSAVARRAISVIASPSRGNGLHPVRAIAERLPLAVAAAERVRSAPLIVRLAARTPEPGVRLFQQVLAERGAGPLLAEEVLGRGWWRSVQATAPRNATSRRWMWNALAVNAFLDALACMPAAAAPVGGHRETITMGGGRVQTSKTRS